MGILRVDVKSDWERAEVLSGIFKLVVPQMYDMLGCSGIITKVPIYAVERLRAVQDCGFEKSEHCLIGGHNGYAYDGYWVIRR